MLGTELRSSVRAVRVVIAKPSFQPHVQSILHIVANLENLTLQITIKVPLGYYVQLTVSGCPWYNHNLVHTPPQMDTW